MINHRQRPQNAISMVKPRSRANGGRSRDSGGLSQCRRGDRTTTLAHVPNYVAQWQPKLKDTEQKRWLQSPWQRRHGLGFCSCCAKHKGQSKAASVWCSPKTCSPQHTALVGLLGVSCRAGEAGGQPGRREQSDSHVSHTSSQWQGRKTH